MDTCGLVLLMSGMAGYTKLFNSILASSVWQESLSTKVLWITLLAMADKDGIAEASVPGLAKIAGLSLNDTEAGLISLSGPDKYSRTKDFEGRRIEACDGGWKILNHPKYRAKMSADDRREYKRLKQQEYRAAKSTMSTGGQSGHNAEAKADTKAESEQRTTDLYRERETISEAAIRLSKEKAADEAEDHLQAEIAEEERHLLQILVNLRDTGQDVQEFCDRIERPKGQAPFNATRALMAGRSGIPNTSAGLTVRRRLCDALEARQRAYETPRISDSNRETMENIRRAGERLKAKQAEQALRQIQ